MLYTVYILWHFVTDIFYILWNIYIEIENWHSKLYIYTHIYIRYSEVKIHYLKYFGMLPSSVNLFLFIHIYIYIYIYICLYLYIFMYIYIYKLHVFFWKCQKLYKYKKYKSSTYWQLNENCKNYLQLDHLKETDKKDKD